MGLHPSEHCSSRVAVRRLRRLSPHVVGRIRRTRPTNEPTPSSKNQRRNARTRRSTPSAVHRAALPKQVVPSPYARWKPRSNTLAAETPSALVRRPNANSRHPLPKHRAALINARQATKLEPRCRSNEPRSPSPAPTPHSDTRRRSAGPFVGRHQYRTSIPHHRSAEKPPNPMPPKRPEPAALTPPKRRESFAPVTPRCHGFAEPAPPKRHEPAVRSSPRANHRSGCPEIPLRTPHPRYLQPGPARLPTPKRQQPFASSLPATRTRQAPDAETPTTLCILAAWQPGPAEPLPPKRQELLEPAPPKRRDSAELAPPRWYDFARLPTPKCRDRVEPTTPKRRALAEPAAPKRHELVARRPELTGQTSPRRLPRLQGFTPRESPPLPAGCLGRRRRVALLGFLPSRVFPLATLARPSPSLPSWAFSHQTRTADEPTLQGVTCREMGSSLSRPPTLLGFAAL
jgi:hypothetical protein